MPKKGRSQQQARKERAGLELCLAPRFRRLQARVLGDRSLSMATQLQPRFSGWPQAVCKPPAPPGPKKHCLIHLGVGKSGPGQAWGQNVAWPVECCAAQLLCGPLGREWGGVKWVLEPLEVTLGVYQQGLRQGVPGPTQTGRFSSPDFHPRPTPPLPRLVFFSLNFSSVLPSHTRMMCM